MTQETAAPPATIPILKSEFENLSCAKEGILDALAMEERFDLLLENYRDLEKEILGQSLNDSLFADISWMQFQDIIITLNRKLFNLLSACRLYLDHQRHSLSSRFGRDSQQYLAIKSVCRHQYDNRLGYRVMENLRNYTQHRGLPVRQISVKNKRIDYQDGNIGLLNTIVLNMDLRELENDNKFKKELIEQIRNGGKYINLMPLIREYVDGIAVIHNESRSLLKEDIYRWDGLFRSALDRYRDSAGSNEITDATVAELDADGLWVQSFDILEEFITRRELLERKNKKAGSYERRFVSNYPDLHTFT